MGEKKIDFEKDGDEIKEFWNNFQILPWKWIDQIFKKPTFFLISAGIMYAYLLLITFYPHNGLFQPVNLWLAGYYDVVFEIDSMYLLILKQYPSMQILLITFLVVVLLAIRWRHKIPGFFRWLWDSNILESDDGDLPEKYYQYLQDYQRSLLSKWGPLTIGIVLFLLTGCMVIVAKPFQFFDFCFEPPAAFVLKIVVFTAMFWMFLLGHLCWSVYITSRYVKNLPNLFSFRVRVSHPDRCGGLKPIGDFVIDAAIILVVAGLALAVVAIFDMDLDQVLSGASKLYLFTIVGPLSALAVFLPIWNIHEKMVENKVSYLDRYGSQLKSLELTILDQTKDSGDLKMAVEAKDKLEILKAIHPEKVEIPVWPFRVTSTILAIFSPQLASSAVGLVVDIIDWVSFVFSK